VIQEGHEEDGLMFEGLTSSTLADDDVDDNNANCS
jgi:hypothetical protein